MSNRGKGRPPNGEASGAPGPAAGQGGAGIVLLGATLAAMLLANSPLAGWYHHLFHAPLAWSPVSRLATGHAWINDGLMALFFLGVGLEVKRELLLGELATPAQRRLPVLAALAGMAMPALVYLALAGSAPGLTRGWAIPAATDIAFAMSIMAIAGKVGGKGAGKGAGKGVPASLRLFLLTVAIVDDIGAVIIIAIFYTSSIDPAWLAASAAFAIVLWLAGRQRICAIWPYAILSIGLWFAVLHSGVHATIAGIVAAMAVPVTGSDGRPVLERVEHALAGWTNLLVVPLFGFANAGLRLDALGPALLFAPLPLAVAAGLFVGKQAGIMAAIAIADRTGLAPRPAGARWAQIWGTAMLCGIGFTMSLFIASLAFAQDPRLVEEAKAGILCGSLLSALAGFALLRLASTRR